MRERVGGRCGEGFRYLSESQAQLSNRYKVPWAPDYSLHPPHDDFITHNQPNYMIKPAAK